MLEQKMISSVEQMREIVLQTSRSRLKGYMIFGAIILVIILILLIAGRPKPPFIVFSILLLCVSLIAGGPMWISEQKLMQSVENNPPTFCTVKRKGMARLGNHSFYHAVYFMYEGKEVYALDYDWGTEPEIKVGDTICVWTNGKTYIMAGDASLKRKH